MKITALDRPAVTALSRDLAALLKTFADERGLDVHVGGGTFDPPTTFKPKLVFTIRESADGKPARQVEFEKHAKSYGFEPTHFGAPFTLGGKLFTIVGLSLRSRTKPVIGARGGKEYIFNVTDVHRALGIDPWNVNSLRDHIKRTEPA